MDNPAKNIKAVESRTDGHQLDPESMKSIRDFVGLFVKTIHTLLLYPKSNSLPGQFREKFFHVAREVLREYPVFLLATTDRGFYFEGNLVFDAEPSDTNPAYALFRDGVREIGLLSTLTEDEANDFLNIFVRALSRTGERIDLANALWELGLRSVYYRTVDHVAEGETIALPTPAEFDQATQLFFSTVNLEGDSGDDGESNNENNPHGYQGVQKDRYNQIRTLFDGEIQIGAAEARQALDMILADAECDCQTETFRIYDEILRNENTAQTMTEIIEITRYQFDTMVEQNQWDVLPRMLANIQSWLTDFADQSSFIDPLRNALYHAGDKQVLSQMAAFLNENPQTELEPFLDYLNRLDRTSLGAVTAMMGDLEHHAARKMVYNFLAERAEDAVDLVGNYVYDKRWFVVRNVALVLGHVNRPRAVTFLKKAAAHSDARVRLEVIRSLSTLHCPEANELLLSMLDDPDNNLRIQAYKALAATPSLEVFEALEQRIQKADLPQLDQRVRRELLGAYARSGGPRALPYLLSLINRKRLFGKARWEKVKTHVVYALGEIGSTSAADVLRRLSQSRAGALSTAASQVLEQRNRKSGEEIESEEAAEP